jgi:glycosyltransferase involved in cell wall biosynthesis
MNKKTKIVMISMFKNEAQNIGKMLESVAPYIDYWILQDNGSTDGTPEVVKAWQERYNIPGFVYQVEEGWVNFGWNRDHLLQKCRQTEHGCDWIMKMDCDETLIVDSDFDWSPFDNHSTQAFHVTSIADPLIYFRAWIWNAKLPWRFNHDPAHETIYLDIEGVGENFERKNLGYKFRLIGGVMQGESYTVPTKYVSDALKLEERLIREGTMLTDLYHFWYIGKSYEDCYRGNFFPLKNIHQEEYARRCIFYFQQILDYTHDYNNTKKAKNIDEMAYFAMNSIGNAYRFLDEHYKAIEFYKESEQFAPPRNDHLVNLAETYWELMDYRRMVQCTEKLMQPERKNPFPEFFFLINQNLYHDTGTHPQYLHKIASELTAQYTTLHLGTVFAVKKENKKRMFIVDDFYDDPELVRNFALQLEYTEDLRYYKGKRTQSYKTPQMRQRFEEIIGKKITVWDEHGMNGVFQYCTPEDALVYHWDNQTWAGMIYLTPGAPYQSGTSLFAHKATGARCETDVGAEYAFNGGYYDRSKFELVDTAGNVFNRLVLFDAKCIHAANEYFGQSIINSRLFHLFFFD